MFVVLFIPASACALPQIRPPIPSLGYKHALQGCFLLSPINQYDIMHCKVWRLKTNVMTSNKGGIISTSLFSNGTYTIYNITLIVLLCILNNTIWVTVHQPTTTSKVHSNRIRCFPHYKSFLKFCYCVYDLPGRLLVRLQARHHVEVAIASSISQAAIVTTS